jgi:hypothetical protein
MAAMSLKQVGHALFSSDLTPYFEEECDVDRITALGHARKSGVPLLKLRLGATIDAPRVVMRAATMLKKRMPQIAPQHRGKLAAWAVHEFIHGACAHCGGAGVRIGDRNVAKSCQPCNASGMRRFSDGERESGTGLRMNMRNNRAFMVLGDWLHMQFHGAIKDVHRALS